jgi:sugar lactone lactonase YvrE
MTDQSGLVYRLSVDGKLDTLLSNGISPNGLVLSPDEKVSQLLRWNTDCQVLYVAMTRENSVWRLPLHEDGTTSKAGKFCELCATHL